MSRVRQTLVGTGIAAAAATAAPFVALFAEIIGEAHGIDGTYAAWLVVVLVAMTPVLHLASGACAGHGSRALAWLAVVPFLALFTRAGVERGLTRPWYFECGQWVIGLIAIPFLVAALVSAFGALSHGLGALRPRVRVRGLVPIALVALGIGFGAIVALVATAPAVPATERLRGEVVTLGAVPMGGEVTIAGSTLRHACPSSPLAACRLEVDGIETEESDGRPLELAEGLGYRFVRGTGTDPQAWLAYRVGESSGRVLEARDLPGRTAAPPGIAAALAVALAVALVYVVLALAAGLRALALRYARAADVVSTGTVSVGGALLACDPALAPGAALAVSPPVDRSTYRVSRGSRVCVIAGTHAQVLDRLAATASEHLAMASVLVALGITPVLAAWASGLVVAI